MPYLSSVGFLRSLWKCLKVATIEDRQWAGMPDAMQWFCCSSPRKRQEGLNNQHKKLVYCCSLWFKSFCCVSFCYSALPGSCQWIDIQILRINWLSVGILFPSCDSIKFLRAALGASSHSRNPPPSEKRHWMGTERDRPVILSLVRTSIFYLNVTLLNFKFALCFVNCHADVWYYLIDQDQSSSVSPSVEGHMLRSCSSCWSSPHLSSFMKSVRCSCHENCVKTNSLWIHPIINSNSGVLSIYSIFKWKITSLSDDLP